MSVTTRSLKAAETLGGDPLAEAAFRSAFSEGHLRGEAEAFRKVASFVSVFGKRGVFGSGLDAPALTRLLEELANEREDDPRGGE